MGKKNKFVILIALALSLTMPGVCSGIELESAETEISSNDATEWVEYIPTEYIQIESVAYSVPKYGGMKKFESHRGFKKSSRQYLLQQNAITLADGLRVAGGRYCVALGSHFTTNIGQCFDLILENGTVIPCVLADTKADRHTDSANIFSNTTRNLCCSEFIVETSLLHPEAKHRGDVSYIYPEWQSPVCTIVVHSMNLLEGL